MARGKNPAETLRLTVSTTPQMKAYLEILLRGGMHGRNAAEAAERLLAEAIGERMKSNDAFATLLRAEAEKWVLGGETAGASHRR